MKMIGICILSFQPGLQLQTHLFAYGYTTIGTQLEYANRIREFSADPKHVRPAQPPPSGRAVNLAWLRLINDRNQLDVRSPASPSNEMPHLRNQTLAD